MSAICVRRPAGAAPRVAAPGAAAPRGAAIRRTDGQPDGQTGGCSRAHVRRLDRLRLRPAAASWCARLLSVYPLAGALSRLPLDPSAADDGTLQHGVTDLWAAASCCICRVPNAADDQAAARPRTSALRLSVCPPAVSVCLSARCVSQLSRSLPQPRSLPFAEQAAARSSMRGTASRPNGNSGSSGSRRPSVSLSVQAAPRSNRGTCSRRRTGTTHRSVRPGSSFRAAPWATSRQRGARSRTWRRRFGGWGRRRLELPPIATASRPRCTTPWRRWSSCGSRGKRTRCSPTRSSRARPKVGCLSIWSAMRTWGQNSAVGCSRPSLLLLVSRGSALGCLDDVGCLKFM
jgi:hypothetical protein